MLVKTGRMQRYLQQNVISTLYSNFDETLSETDATKILHPAFCYNLHHTSDNIYSFVAYILVSRIRTFDPQLNFNYVTTAAVR